jgi:hypothetical protein
VAARPIPKEVVDAVLIDWRIGRLSQQDIAERHRVSKGTVNKICKGVPQDFASIVTAGVQFNQALAPHDDRIVTAIHDAVEEELRLRKFFRGANMLVANTVATKVREQGKSASFQDLNAAASALGRTQESVLGKAPEVVVNNTNSLPLVMNLSPAELRRINQELEDAC